MSKRAQEALEKSIQHWERMKVMKTPNEEKPSAKSCDLCILYEDNRCKSCPVKIATGVIRCAGTPYLTAYSHHIKWGNMGDNKNRALFRRAATKEINFLKSLRDK